MIIRVAVLMLGYSVVLGGFGAAMAQQSFYTLSERDVVFVVDSTGKPIAPDYDGLLQTPYVTLGVIDGWKVFVLNVAVDRNSVSPEESFFIYLTSNCSGTPYIWSHPDDLIEQALLDNVGDVWVPTGGPVTVTPGSIRYPWDLSQCETYSPGGPSTYLQLKRTSMNFYDRFPPPYSLQVRYID